MEKKYMERLKGKYCKIVTKEPGEKRASVVTGTLEDIDYDDGFILVDSSQGLGCLRINTIVAIKPGNKNKINKKSPKAKISKDTKAMVGIGTLIVFIAMILIAAVASSVLIQTSETLQQRARTVGTSTIREVSAGMTIEDVTGYCDENKTLIQYLALGVRPRAGSKDIDLSLAHMSIKYENLSILALNESLVQSVNTDGQSVFYTPVYSGSNYTILDNVSAVDFGVIVLHDADGSVTNTYGMNSGDKILIIVNLSALIPSTNGLPAREDIAGEIQPELGSSGSFECTAPAVFSNRIVDLW